MESSGGGGGAKELTRRGEWKEGRQRSLCRGGVAKGVFSGLPGISANQQTLTNSLITRLNSTVIGIRIQAAMPNTHFRLSMFLRYLNSAVFNFITMICLLVALNSTAGCMFISCFFSYWSKSGLNDTV